MDNKQFELEQGIMNCWNVCEDMKILAENVLEAKHVDRDKIVNILLGMTELYQLKFEKTFQHFEDTLKYMYEQREQIRSGKKETTENIEDRHWIY